MYFYTKEGKNNLRQRYFGGFDCFHGNEMRTPLLFSESGEIIFIPGEKLVSVLNYILDLSVINYLGKYKT